MARVISFKTGRRTPTLFRLLRDRYLKDGIDDGYIAFKWEEWGKNPSITVFRAVKNNRVVGWIFYDRKTSTIEEMLVEGTWKGKDPRPEMLDTLIARESLVAASLLTADQEKYELLIGYGFRPTLFFHRNGFRPGQDGTGCVGAAEDGRGQTIPRLSKENASPWRRYHPPRHTKRSRKDLPVSSTGSARLRRFVKPGQTVAIKPNVVATMALRTEKVVGGIVTGASVSSKP